MHELPHEVNYNQPQICPACHSTVRMITTQQGLSFCPVCGYSPTLKTKVRSSTALETGCVLSGAPGVNVNIKDNN